MLSDFKARLSVSLLQHKGPPIVAGASLVLIAEDISPIDNIARFRAIEIVNPQQ
jgi:hypothetical protein